MIAFVAVYEVYKQFAGQAPQAADASNLEVVAPAGLQDANNGSAQPQAGGAGISKEFRKLLVRRLQTQGFSDLLVSSGRPAKFQPVSALRLPEPGKAVTVTVLLYSPLDAFTETWWRKVGMLKSAAASGNPFLRSVTIESQEALDCLVDWHVEGFVEGVVTIKPPALESEPQGNSANVPRASRPPVAGRQGARTKAGGTPAVRSGPRIY
ncbi:MAG: hypothetical protein ABSE73_21115 [Planctomycetota bacterium]